MWKTLFGQNVLDPLGNPSSLEDDVFRATLITLYLCMIKLLIGKELYDVVTHAHGVLRYVHIYISRETYHIDN